jgi:hypothetical protein
LIIVNELANQIYKWAENAKYKTSFDKSQNK